MEGNGGGEGGGRGGGRVEVVLIVINDHLVEYIYFV